MNGDGVLFLIRMFGINYVRAAHSVRVSMLLVICVIWWC